MKFVKTDEELTWTAKWGAALYSVYFGTDPAEVEAATGAAPSGKNTFDPGPIELETAYYWRVDTFDGAQWYTGDEYPFCPFGHKRERYAANAGMSLCRNSRRIGRIGKCETYQKTGVFWPKS